MAYQLGVDIGTTFTAAAIFRDGHVEVASLETHQVTVPTVVFADGQQLEFGYAALQRGRTDPAGLERAFKRRLGDPVKIMLGGVEHTAEDLLARFADWVVDLVTEQMGEPPTRIALTHPANWTSHQLGLLRRAIATTKIGEVDPLSEPEAAALDYASVHRVEPGQLILVYDLGGGTFDTTLLRRDADGFTPVGDAAGIPDLGGIDFDDLIMEYVREHVPADVIAQARAERHPGLHDLRRAATEAKEGLSKATSVDIPVLLPGYSRAVRLTRAEFEALIRPALLRTIEKVRETVRTANVPVSSLSAALLVGGSSRIPCVSELLASQLGVVTKVDVHAKLVVVRGAARWAATSGVVTATATARDKRPARRDATGEATGDERRRRFRDALNPLSTNRSGATGLRFTDLLKFGVVMAVVAGAIVAIALAVRHRPTVTVVSKAPSPISVHLDAPRTSGFLEGSAATYAQSFAQRSTTSQRRQACQAYFGTLTPLSTDLGSPVPEGVATELATLTQQNAGAAYLDRLVIRWTEFWNTCAQRDLSDVDLTNLFNAIETASSDCVRAGVCAQATAATTPPTT